MMGRQDRDQGQLFYCFNLEEAVPEGVLVAVAVSSDLNRKHNGGVRRGAAYRSTRIWRVATSERRSAAASTSWRIACSSWLTLSRGGVGKKADPHRAFSCNPVTSSRSCVPPREREGGFRRDERSSAQPRLRAALPRLNNVHAAELSSGQHGTNTRGCPMESIGEQQFERMAMGAGAVFSAMPESLGASYHAGLEIAQKCTSKLFEHAQSNLASLFEYLEQASRAGSPSDVAGVTARFLQTQTETLFRQMNEIVATAQKATITKLDASQPTASRMDATKTAIAKMDAPKSVRR
jgi:hypothetical protein